MLCDCRCKARKLFHVETAVKSQGFVFLLSLPYDLAKAGDHQNRAADIEQYGFVAG